MGQSNYTEQQLLAAVLSRWQRIQLVRDLSTAAAGEEEGGELGVIGSRYARVSKPGHEEQSRARRIQAGQIFERQVGISLGPLSLS